MALVIHRKPIRVNCNLSLLKVWYNNLIFKGENVPESLWGRLFLGEDVPKSSRRNLFQGEDVLKSLRGNLFQG